MIIFIASYIGIARLGIAHISPVPERIEVGRCRICTCQGTGRQEFAPCIVPVLYHQLSAGVKRSGSIAQKGMKTNVLRAVAAIAGRLRASK